MKTLVGWSLSNVIAISGPMLSHTVVKAFQLWGHLGRMRSTKQAWKLTMSITNCWMFWEGWPSTFNIHKLSLSHTRIHIHVLKHPPNSNGPVSFYFRKHIYFFYPFQPWAFLLIFLHILFLFLPSCYTQASSSASYCEILVILMVKIKPYFLMLSHWNVQ